MLFQLHYFMALSPFLLKATHQYIIEICFKRATSPVIESNTQYCVLWQNNRELGGVVIRGMKQSVIRVGVF